MRKLTDGSEDWNAQPQCVHLIEDFNISKAGNKYPEAGFGN